jgi:hypothetical protein
LFEEFVETLLGSHKFDGGGKLIYPSCANLSCTFDDKRCISGNVTDVEEGIFIGKLFTFETLTVGEGPNPNRAIRASSLASGENGKGWIVGAGILMGKVFILETTEGVTTEGAETFET